MILDKTTESERLYIVVTKLCKAVARRNSGNTVSLVKKFK